MKKRRLSILLSIVMLLSLLPTMALATGEITTGNAKVTAPVAGQTPSFTATSDEPEKYSVKVLRWIDVENNQDITSLTLTDPASYYYNYTFEGGKEYTAVVEFTAVGDNTLSYSNSFTINGETTYWQGNGLYRFHTFTATGTGGGEGTKVYSATVADINITLPAGYTSNDINDLGKDRMIKFTNTGTETLYISEPTLSGTNASDFSVRSFGNHVVTPGSTNTTAYAIEPNIGLAPGTYTATISCTDDNNKLSVPVTAKVTLTVSDHNWDTSKWEFNPFTHWHKCTDSGCSAKRDEAAHNSDKVVGAKNATFDTDGYTGDKYCSICDREMEIGKAIAAGKYIRESKATMTPAGIDNTISANDLVFTSLDTSKYTVGLYRVFDMTDTTLNTVGMGYPHDKKFISGHKYAIEFEFEAVAPYVYDTMHDTHSSTFKLNDADTMMSAATTHAGSPARRVELVAGGVSVATYDLTTSVNGGHGTISAGENGITEGTSKIITFTPDSGYEIDKVMVNGTETTVTGNTLTVTMDGNKNVVVTYKAIEYSITVTDGKATIGAGSEISKAAQGTIVTLTANAAPSGKVFDKWEVVSGGITLADANSATTTFTMPASAVSVKATYKTTPVTTYDLTTQVNGGHGTISASKTGLTAGSTETITFNPEVGYEIDTVTVNGTATSVSGNTLNVTMNENKTVVVTYKAVEYNITVTDGKATVDAGSEISKAAQGTIVTLTANAAPSGKVFDKWEVVSGGITLADANSATTTFTMPASAVSVKATYKNIPVVTYTVSFGANGGTGSMADATGISGEYTLPANGFTAPDGKQFKGWATSASGTVITGTSITVSADTTLYAIWTNIGGGGGSSSGGGSYVPKTQKPEIKAAAGGKTVLSKDGTTLTITADAGKVIDKVLLNGKDMGAVSELKGLKTGDKVEVIFKDQVTEPTKEQLDKAAKEATGELVLAARSAKLKNGSVKIMLKDDLKAITDAGYTVKYKFYRSTKKSAGYKSVLTKKAPTYYNTYGKKGTMYYYKARVMIYDKDGNFVAQTALKQCKYANRLWTK